MKAHELRQLAPEELAQRVRESAADLADMRLKNRTSSGLLDKPIRIRHLRREVARMKTIAHGGKK